MIRQENGHDRYTGLPGLHLQPLLSGAAGPSPRNTAEVFPAGARLEVGWDVKFILFSASSAQYLLAVILSHRGKLQVFTNAIKSEFKDRKCLFSPY